MNAPTDDETMDSDMLYDEVGEEEEPEFDEEEEKLTFSKIEGKMIVTENEEEEINDEPETKSDAVGLPLPSAAVGTEKTKSQSENPENN